MDSYHHGDLKQTLIKQAFIVLESQGIESLSLRDLAERAGVSKNAPYRHFASKRDLLAALAADGFGELADAIEGAQATPDQNSHNTIAHQLGILREMFRLYLDFARRRPACYRLMFGPLGATLHSESCRLNSARAFGALVQAVGIAHQNGWRNEFDHMGLVLQIWSTLHGWASILNDKMLPPDVESAASYPLENLLFTPPSPGDPNTPH